MRILLAYMREDEMLKNCLESLKKFAPEIPIEMLKVNPKETKVCEELYQKWINEHEPEDIMCWHPDMIATREMKLIELQPRFDVTGLKIVYPDGTLNHYGGSIIADGRGCHPHQGQLDIGLTRQQEVAYVTGPGMIIKKEVIAKFKELKKPLWDFQFTYYIDVDFCFSARELGFKVGVIPVRAIHFEGMETLKQRSQVVTNQMQAESYYKFQAKWMHELSKYKGIPENLQ